LPVGTGMEAESRSLIDAEEAQLRGDVTQKRVHALHIGTPQRLVTLRESLERAFEAPALVELFEEYQVEAV